MKKQNDEAIVFGKRLRLFRMKKSLSAEEVARRIGVAPSTYREWENGRAITGLPYRQLTEVYEVSLTELFYDQQSKNFELRECLNAIEVNVKKIRSAL